jgi:transcriptional regulator of acetoin/glycerol metabolism
MIHSMQTVTRNVRDHRLHQIALARQVILQDGATISNTGLQGWIERSWQRCLTSGKRPDQAPSFDMVTSAAARRLVDLHQDLLRTARPVLKSLSQAIASTRYFAVMTDAQGIVIDAHGPIDRSDRRAELITRIGTDLSERKIATTAIGAALTELQPVWLHRGEHFFDANSVYSCAGAPVFGPEGACVGMLDLTGIEAVERPELTHLVAQAARSIENALTLNQLKSKGDLLIRLNWPGRALGDETDGLICLNAEGCVIAANQMARLMVPQLAAALATAHPLLHATDLFAMAPGILFDAARRQSSKAAIRVPLWTGLQLHALPVLGTPVDAAACAQPEQPVPATPLKDIETALIRQAVDDARGNVMQAAKALGISRATVYRRLGASITRH